MSTLQIKALHPIYCSGRAVSHTCLSVCEHLRNRHIRIGLLVPASDPAARRVFTRDALAPWLRRIALRLMGESDRLQHFTERKFLRWLTPEDVAYLWPGVSLAVYERVKAGGGTLIVERINCHRATSRRILDEAYARLGWRPTHGIRDADVELERRKLALADLVFAPSPTVRASLEQAGVPGARILSVSYGWDPRRFAGRDRSLPPADGLTVLFVGYLCVRKGAHLLLSAWAQARVPGRLVLAGRVAPDIAANCADQLNRPDVVHIAHTDAIGAVYRSADVFAFPTLEEGSPLVSYEALACGIPLLISPMGAGEIVRDGREGLVRDPYEQAAWVAALQRLARDRDLRAALAVGAAARAGAYTWPHAGARRRRVLLAALRATPPSAAPVTPGAAPAAADSGRTARIAQPAQAHVR
ncbi:MAG: glycosyltransferase family 4 protein [Planctomycetota bacterium]